ncbi:hypothetical protein [Oscillatoria sp. FACHB-1406]|uniref:hypothetical protein n=1 Tax=Oscillatoria sp. FACHB-1406 TaxID=2692846 RepID=UPI00168375DE|nr:hypothetical protein [Oscillatoria sp. FACHB-1406]MBD2580671.1 hypothetical protein [Oscillatoria sp. FACHB-1406]
MSLSLNQIEKKIEEIDRFANSSSQRYGRLLNWQNPPDPFWHYGIGLSDTHIFDTGRGLIPFERSEAKLVVGIDQIAFKPKLTIARLKYALYVFADWEYSLTGWNCEHLGRLIATDCPRCYQSSPIWWLCNMTPEGDHKIAHRIFNDYLKKVDSSLNR